MNAREWEIMLLEVEQEFAELVAEFEREWMGYRMELLEAQNGVQEEVHGQEGRQLE